MRMRRGRLADRRPSLSLNSRFWYQLRSIVNVIKSNRVASADLSRDVRITSGRPAGIGPHYILL